MCGKVAALAGTSRGEGERGGDVAPAVSCLLCFIVVFLDVTLMLPGNDHEYICTYSQPDPLCMWLLPIKCLEQRATSILQHIPHTTWHCPTLAAEDYATQFVAVIVVVVKF